jgi:hypothetical protein
MGEKDSVHLEVSTMGAGSWTEFLEVEERYYQRSDFSGDRRAFGSLATTLTQSIH